MEEIKDRLAEALRIRGLLPVELAKQSGINKGTISRYLKGTVVPKQSAIGEMAVALRVSPAWLLGYDVPMEDTVIELDKLSKNNRERLVAYYQALIDSQGE